MMIVLLQLLPVSEKAKMLSLRKGFSTLAYSGGAPINVQPPFF